MRHKFNKHVACDTTQLEIYIYINGKILYRKWLSHMSWHSVCEVGARVSRMLQNNSYSSHNLIITVGQTFCSTVIHVKQRCFRLFVPVVSFAASFFSAGTWQGRMPGLRDQWGRLTRWGSKVNLTLHWPFPRRSHPCSPDHSCIVDLYHHQEESHSYHGCYTETLDRRTGWGWCLSLREEGKRWSS